MCFEIGRLKLGVVWAGGQKRVHSEYQHAPAKTKLMPGREPVFHEQRYLEKELPMLEAAASSVKPLRGAMIEIGCWEGRSAAVIANACYPDVLIAVDTWAGSLTELPAHETVRIAKIPDVFAALVANIKRATRGNFE